MVPDWAFTFPFALSDGQRELALRRLRAMAAACAPDSPLAAVVGEFLAAVEARRDPVSLRVGHLDPIGMIHLSAALGPRGLVTESGAVTCLSCEGSGTLRLPPVMTGLQAKFDSEFSLSHLSDADRVAFLDQHPDPAVRASRAAEKLAEAQRRRDELRRSERSLVVLEPGTPRAAAAAADYLPTSARKQLEDA